MAAPRLTDRDHLLLGLLALARYLSSSQLARLVFPGRSDSVYSGRLNRLMRGEAGRSGFVRRLAYRTYQGELVPVWALTAAGYLAAEGSLGSLPRIARRDVGAMFLEHTVRLNELFCALVAGEGGAPAELPRSFRWVPSESSLLPFREYVAGEGTRERLIVPDAILELPSAGRRVFLECEMGTHPIAKAHDPRGGATLSKVERYESYLNGFADVAGRVTFYSRAFGDGLAPEVLFLVMSPARRDHASEAIDDWRRGRAGRPLSVRVLTLDDASRELRAAVRGLPVPAAAPSPAASNGAALSEAEIAAVARFYGEAIESIRDTRHAVRTEQEAGRPSVDLPEYPDSSEDVRDLLARLQRGVGQRTQA
jgi:hypothetical protein